MPLGIEDFRKLVALDEDDPLSRFALGQALFKESDNPQLLTEAAEHLSFTNAKDPGHLATYYILGQVLIKLGRNGEARKVLEAGQVKAAGVGHGMGHDLGPLMAELIESIPPN